MTDIFKYYVELYNKFFTSLTSDNNINLDQYIHSVLWSNKSNFDSYINNVVKLPVYDNDATSLTLDYLSNVFSSLKTVLDIHKPNLNIIVLNPLVIDNLLKSFGFPITNLPLLTKRKILSILVNSYKHKGSISSLKNILDTLGFDSEVKELWLTKRDEDIYFKWQNDDNSYTFVDYDKVIDKHWWLEKSDVLNIFGSNLMSPFFVVSKTTDLSEILTGLNTLKKLAYDDYMILSISPETYNETKVLKIDSLPEKFSHLELFYMLRYFYLVLRNLNITEEISNSFTHRNLETESLPVIQRDYNENFSTRYDNEFTSIETKQRRLMGEGRYIHTLISKINRNELYKYTDFNFYTTIIPYKTKVLLLFPFSYPNPQNTIVIVNLREVGTETVIEVPFTPPFGFVSFIYDNKLCIMGGNYLDGSSNEYLYIIDLDTYEVKKTYFPINISLYRPTTIYHDSTNISYILDLTEDFDLVIYKQTGIKSYPKFLASVRSLLGKNCTKVNSILHHTYTENEILLFLDVYYQDIDETKLVLIKVDVRQDKVSIADLPDIFLNYYNSIPFPVLSSVAFTEIIVFLFYNFFTRTLHQVYYCCDSFFEYQEYPSERIDGEYFKIDKEDFTAVPITSSNPYVSIAISFDFENPTSILYYLNDYKLQDTEFLPLEITYNCDEENARCLKDSLLEKRKTTLIRTDYPLPNFSNFQDLENFLYELTPNNINHFKISSNKELIYYELLLIASQVSNTDLSIIWNEYLVNVSKKLIEFFKPVYSRPYAFINKININDLVGDWIAGADNIDRLISKFLSDFIGLKENTLVKLNSIINDNINLLDVIQNSINANIELLSYDGNITNSFVTEEYLEGLTKTISLLSKNVGQQYINTSISGLDLINYIYQIPIGQQYISTTTYIEKPGIYIYPKTISQQYISTLLNITT